ncbi:MAG: hypothetical protein PHE83_04935 [Opitutaceae bacterium]|nr:hypothetical protein [Opitutaceae bacterium]
MRKLFLALGIVAVIAVGAVVVLSFFLGSIVKAGVNKFGPVITKTRVELAGASISPLIGGGTISGLFIGNPPGWQSDKAVYLGQASLSVAPFSILGDHIVIEEIVIDQPEFVYETKIISSNIKDLLKNIEASTKTGAGAPASAKEGKPIKFEVRRFHLQNGRVTIGVGPTAVTVPMPPITLTDLGTKEGGIAASQLALAVMSNVLDHVLTTAAGAVANVGKSAGSAATDAAAAAAKKAGDDLKNFFGGKK